MPTVSPPPEQSDGGLDCGPNTVKVTVPVGDAPPDSDADSDVPEIAVPAVPAEGAWTELNDGAAEATAVSAIPAPQVEAAVSLFESPS